VTIQLSFDLIRTIFKRDAKTAGIRYRTWQKKEGAFTILRLRLLKEEGTKQVFDILNKCQTLINEAFESNNVDGHCILHVDFGYREVTGRVIVPEEGQTTLIEYW
jgi:hypothetical protein